MSLINFLPKIFIGALAGFFAFATLNTFAAEKSYDSFLVTVGDKKISVVSPSKKKKVVTIVIKNTTYNKIISKIRTEDKTLERFVLAPAGSRGAVHTLTVDASKLKELYYVSVAPPFQEVPLAFSKGNYEIP